MCGLVCPLVSRVESYLGNSLQPVPPTPSFLLFSIILEKDSSFVRYLDYSGFLFST